MKEIVDLYWPSIARGMALLDEKLGPDWINHIDLDSLRLDSTCLCVVGQLFDLGGGMAHTLELDPEEIYDNGQFSAGLDFLLGDYRTDDDDEDLRPEYYGFDREGDQNYNDLTMAWKQAILARR